MQGFVSGKGFKKETASLFQQLEAEIVIGHEEYRKVIHGAPWFRRTFAEVYRDRTLLFMGAGLRDPYLLDLFGEVVELLGPNPSLHFALARKDELDSTFLRTRFNIQVIEYDNHVEVVAMVKALASAVIDEHSRQTRWSFQMRAPARTVARSSVDFEVIRGGIPAPTGGECVGISVGRSLRKRKFLLGAQYQRIMGELVPAIPGLKAFLDGPAMPTPKTSASPVARLAHYPVYLIAARDEHGRRDVRHVSKAVTALLDRAQADGFTRVMCSLIAGGRQRISPRPLLLSEMVRAYSAWYARNAERRVAMSVFLVEADLLSMVASSQLNVAEILTCSDARFWCELFAGKDLRERSVVHRGLDSTVGELLVEMCGCEPEGRWRLEVEPQPYRGFDAARISDIRSRKLSDVGVTMGCTLRFIFGKT
jgi:hypothetical protein